MSHTVTLVLDDPSFTTAAGDVVIQLGDDSIIVIDGDDSSMLALIDALAEAVRARRDGGMVDAMEQAKATARATHLKWVSERDNGDAAVALVLADATDGLA